MDSSCRSISSKKKKNSEKKQGGIDRLSNLPDFLLHHVLSFLETKDVVRTSVLSTRWRYLCNSLAIINLKYYPAGIEDETQRQHLMNSFLEFVGRLLILHDASVIRKLHLESCIQVHKSRVNCWICAVTKHNIQDLFLKVNNDQDLYYDMEGYFVLPSCLFTCPSLVTLKLFAQCELKVPLTIHLPNLKILHFHRVSFPDNVSVKRLISSCPSLDELALVQCNWHDDEGVTISLPMLRTLTIKTDELDEKFSDPHIEVIAANLSCLNISYLEVDFELSGLCSLDTASVDISYQDVDDDERIFEFRGLRLFSAINNVESLTLTTETVKSLMSWEASLDNTPTFYNLTRLTVDQRYRGRCFVFLLAFLDKMPKLEYLVISKDCYGRECENDSTHLRDEVMQKRVPTCFHSNLKTFATQEFEGDLPEMLMIEYVLRNATGLESLFIYCSKRLQEERLSKAKYHLLNINWGSASCNVEFRFS